MAPGSPSRASQAGLRLQPPEQQLALWRLEEQVPLTDASIPGTPVRQAAHPEFSLCEEPALRGRRHTRMEVSQNSLQEPGQ